MFSSLWCCLDDRYFCSVMKTCFNLLHFALLCFGFFFFNLVFDCLYYLIFECCVCPYLIDYIETLTMPRHWRTLLRLVLCRSRYWRKSLRHHYGWCYADTSRGIFETDAWQNLCSVDHFELNIYLFFGWFKLSLSFIYFFILIFLF